MLAQLPVAFRWGTCMSITLALLEECDSIYMLKDWEHSKGAQIEHTFAAGLGKEIVYEKAKGSDTVSEPEDEDINTGIAASSI